MLYLFYPQDGSVNQFGQNSNNPAEHNSASILLELFVYYTASLRSW